MSIEPSSDYRDLVSEVRVWVDDDNDFSIEVRTEYYKFIFIVVISNYQELGWMESAAISDCMQYTHHGTRFGKKNFLSALKALGKKYRIRGPNVEAPSTTGPTSTVIEMGAVIEPGFRFFKESSEDILLHTFIKYDRTDNLFFFNSYTKKNTAFALILYLTMPSGYLNPQEHGIFCEILNFLQPGNVVSESVFQQSLLPSITNLGVHLPVRVRNFDELDVPGIGVEIGIPSRSPLSSSSTLSTSSIPSSSVSDIENSPYPGIKYKKYLKKSGQAQVIIAEMEGATVAVKVFRNGGGQTDSYRTELTMLLQIPKHPNVVKVITFFERPKPALVMEYIEGPDLFDHLKESGPFGQDEGLKICTGIAAGLSHLHEHRIIHRDLKSANILLRKDGSPVIIDLGLSSILMEDSSTRTITNGSFGGATGGGNQQIPNTIPETQRLSMQSAQIFKQTLGVRGTLLWLSPEMITSNIWSERTDVYSFAVIMWEIYSGKVPFQLQINNGMSEMALMIQIANGLRPSVYEISTGLDRWIRKLIQDCWAHIPTSRPVMRDVLLKLKMYDHEALFKEADEDRSEEIHFSEFTSFLHKFAPGQVTPEQMLSLFNQHDSRNSNALTFLDFKAALENISLDV